MDVAGAVWTIAAERMKAKREHRVPLCGRAVGLLEAARALGGGDGLVFPMRSGRPIAASTLPKMLQLHGISAVAHGFRSSFRDWAAERTDHPREVIEAALAHVVPNKVEAAYARSDLFERRRLLMDEWAAYVGERGQESERPDAIRHVGQSEQKLPTRPSDRAVDRSHAAQLGRAAPDVIRKRDRLLTVAYGHR